MSKYGSVARKDGHSKWFLQKTLKEHDRSMDHPWMKMIYSQSFAMTQYTTWLAQNLAIFGALEASESDSEAAAKLRRVLDTKLHRSEPLRADLQQLLGSEWQQEAARVAEQSGAARRYVTHLSEDASNPCLLLAHHFLQYNAVLSGGAYLGKMASEKLCVPLGAPGVRFFAFEGIDHDKGSARVQQYLRDFDTVELSHEERDAMLVAMQRVYADMEAMMQEIYEMSPASGVDYKSAKEQSSNLAAPSPCVPQLSLQLSELHNFSGAKDGDRILFSLDRELLDVTAGRELYGPGGGYALFAGHDVTRCLGTMDLDPELLDDCIWEPGSDEDRETLKQWKEKLKAKYPVAGILQSPSPMMPTGTQQSETGLRRRKIDGLGSGNTDSPAKSADEKTAADSSGQRCPISGKEGTCPMASILGIKAEPKVPATASTAKSSGGSGFAAGKSLVASVSEKKTGFNWEDSFLYRLCPLHWDEKMIKILLIVAVCSWTSGVFIGWRLRKELFG